jgi:hypothetical protein
VRYYFAVRDGQHYPDDTGYVFTGPNEAVGYAETLAFELAKEPHLQGSCIIITSEQGAEIARVPIGGEHHNSVGEIRR